MGKRESMTDEQRRAAIAERYPGMLERLGNESDSKIATDFGITKGAVQSIRDSLDITANRPTISSGMSDEERRAVYDQRYPGVVARLGNEVDAAIAEDYGITRVAIYRIRKDLGIPAASRTAYRTADKLPLEGRVFLRGHDGEDLGAIDCRLTLVLPVDLSAEDVEGVTAELEVSK